ncbi:uncharacterized protein LOC133307589 [Gastrolobium bilobum]|uniref:uncharacterized protein LOC133307589 n=1 Tax=Gastrolobium bilobum TaxID=150636 RepID=UPI002AB29FA4|nr:uncharacterized protein LOC133307589 [Gastrolobium bilobum]
MINKLAFEALDLSRKDIMRFTNSNSEERPFGGKCDVLRGDFCQILPVIPKATKEDIVSTTINSSKLWSHCKNMKDFKFFEERVILTPTLEAVEMTNEFILSQVSDEKKEYVGSDSYCIADEDVGIEPNWFTVEFLNEIKCFGFPNHKITLKKEFLLCF